MDEDKKKPTNTSVEGGKPSVNGKTLGDVWDSVLTEPRKLLTLVSLLAALSGLAMFEVFVFTRLFHVEPSEVRLGGTDPHVLFQRVEERTGSTEYLLMVSPQGWQSAGVVLHAGDHVSFTAGGRVCVDMSEILEKVRLRKEYEDELVHGPPHIRPFDPEETRVPEDFFTEKQKQSLILDRPWVDPNGFSLDQFKPSFRSRKDRYLLPNQPAGGLLAAIIDGSAEPGKQDAFFVGRENDIVASKAGVLWFTVNDVQYNDPNNPNLFYNDNLGTFWVRVIVKRS
ncbi:MAG: hypothetical protein ABR905_06445 [Terracidiphilus sp.]|jgi:hypothetical protein